MNLFFKKAILLSLPIILLAACYIITDPFKKIWNYDNYKCDYIMLNRGDVSTRVFLKNKDKYKYDSFIFGSSRSTAHTSSEWGKYLTEDNMAYSYGAWSESIKGIYRKLELIDSYNVRIKNTFIIIDDHTFDQDSTNDIFLRDHFLISGKSRIDYYFRDFLSYITDPVLIITSIDYNIFHKKRWYMKGFIGMSEEDLNPVTNDWMVNSEKLILADSILFYEKCKDKFYERSKIQQYSNRQILADDERVLKKIKEIFNKQNTNYKIVIAPLYNQKKINPADLSVLQKYFGADNVFDYSGINDITKDYHNYAADMIHYRKKIGNLIFKEIYCN